MSDQYNKTSASPKVRKFARELGVDINSVKGSERLGRVVEKDLKEFVSSNINPVSYTHLTLPTSR